MSSISSYLTINNVAYASTALFTGVSVYSAVTDLKARYADPLSNICTAFTLIGITAVVIKEKSFQSSLPAIITSLAFGSFIAYNTAKNSDTKWEKATLFGVGFNVGLFAYAALRLIITVGTQVARHMPQR